MKTNKEDIRALKSKHRIELVMTECGEKFEVDAQDKNIWRSTSTPGLTLDLYRQSFELSQAGKSQQGDVLAWLQHHYRWTFSMALKFLKSRPADPKRQDQPQAKKAKRTPAVEDDVKPLDRWQQKALDIAGERIRECFTWSTWNLILYIDDVRIDPAIAPGETHCQRCEKLLGWDRAVENSTIVIPNHKRSYVGPLPIVAYSIKKRIKTFDLELNGRGKIEDAINDVINVLGSVFVEEDDGVVCEECAWREFNFHRAITLCIKSAQKREEAESKKREQKEQEQKEQEERERRRDEAAELSVTAGRGASA